ncbi:MAG TPA: DNA polymerase III subunit gamma/tau, partial [Sphingobacteriaceae bacterium]|nr:DNA polymerase III subunit gamma/tau [Sphingobacteriaceae bacterium]
TPAPAEAPKPTAASWSKAKLSVGLDLNDLGSNPQEEDKEPVLVSGDVFEPIQMDVLLKEWHALADRYKAANKINIFTLLTAHPPRLVGDAQIEMVIENTIQRDLLVVEKPDMVNALRQSLRNYAIHIQEVLEDNPVTRKPYTAQEKYQAMIQKNEILDRLRQDFNLGLE